MNFLQSINFTILKILAQVIVSILVLVFMKKKLCLALSQINSRFILVQILQNYFGLQTWLFVYSTLLLCYIFISLRSIISIANNLEYSCTHLCQLIGKISNANIRNVNFDQQLIIDRSYFKKSIVLIQVLSVVSIFLYGRLIVQPQGELNNVIVKSLDTQISDKQASESNAYINDDEQELTVEDKIMQQQLQKQKKLKNMDIKFFIPTINDITQLKPEHQAILRYVQSSCKVCNNINVINCEHVEMEDQCFQNFDHTCPWTGRHITGTNMRRFIHYLCSVALITIISTYFCLKTLLLEIRFLKYDVFNEQKIGIFYIIPMLLLRSDDSQVLLLSLCSLTIVASIPVTILYTLQKSIKKGTIQIAKIVDNQINQEDSNVQYIVLSQKKHLVIDSEGNFVKVSKMKENQLYQLSGEQRNYVQPIDFISARKIMRTFPYKCSPFKKWTWYKMLDKLYKLQNK